MADKYLIHGATYDGDGTASNAAASAGASGAWNTINYFLSGAVPTYGTLAAGDRIFIRSKSSAGADIGLTMVANPTYIGSASATAALPFTWILDNGVIWSGINGVFTIACAAVSPTTSALRAYNNLISLTPWNWKFYMPAGGTANANTLTVVDGSLLDGIMVDTSEHVGTQTRSGLYVNQGSAKLHNIYIKSGRLATSGNALAINLWNNRVEATGLHIELTDTSASQTPAIWCDVAGGWGGVLEVVGGSVYGAGATTGNIPLLGPAAGEETPVKLMGFQFPIEMPLGGNVYPASYNSETDMTGVDGAFGSVKRRYWGFADSRNDGNYPTLNATLPNSALTPWSWRLYPRDITRVTPQLHLSKVWQQDPAQLVVTVECLAENTLRGNLTKANSWIAVTYVNNATGRQTTEYSRLTTATAVASSTAAWTSTTWGVVSCTKLKYILTTAGSVKKDTQIMVTLNVNVAAGSSSQVVFVCPDFSLVTV